MIDIGFDKFEGVMQGDDIVDGVAMSVVCVSFGSVVVVDAIGFTCVCVL